MRSNSVLVLAALCAVGILTLIWYRLGEGDAELVAPQGGAGSQATLAEDLRPRADSTPEPEPAQAPARTEVAEEGGGAEPESPARPKSYRWADYIEVDFVIEGMQPVQSQVRFLPHGVTVHVEGVEQPLDLDDPGAQIRTDTDCYYLTDYYKDEGWRIARVIVEDPRFEPVDFTFEEPQAKALISLRGSSTLQVEVIDAETREAIDRWTGQVLSSGSGGEGSATLHPAAEGQARSVQLVSACYWIEASAPGYAVGGASVDLAPGERARAVVELSSSATVSGTVIFEDFSPVPDARVRLAFPGAPGMELPTLGSRPLFAADNSIAPYYQWHAETISGADGTFELAASATAPMIIEATVGEVFPQRVRVEGVVGESLSDVQIVLPRGARFTGRVVGPAPAAERGYLIRACGHGGPGNTPGEQWDQEYGDSFQAAWVDADGHFDLGPFSTKSGVNFYLFDAPLRLSPFQWLEGEGVQQLHHQVIKPKGAGFEPVEIVLE
ncbi:MAG: hypothetical protein ACYS26_01250 [Planctomycetota bacterium]|jgi:hypothetical protein